eukprot:s2924_g5.t1
MKVDRLGVLCARLGLCSRNEAVRYARLGQILVDGQPAKSAAVLVASDAAIELSARAKRMQADKVTLLLNKPLRYASCRAPPGVPLARKLLVPENRALNCRTRHDPRQLSKLDAVDILDEASTGVLLFSQDGRVATCVSRDPQLDKEYKIISTGEATPSQLRALELSLSTVCFGEVKVDLEKEKKYIPRAQKAKAPSVAQESETKPAESSTIRVVICGSANESTLKNPTGIGGKAGIAENWSWFQGFDFLKPSFSIPVAIPENWNSNPRTPNYKEFRKFNCTSQEAFEVRLSKKGWPMRSFVRCFRVAWLLLNNWYKPQVINQTSLLDKWPPPKKYSHEDWLGWTQADQATNLQIQEYCQAMRSGLRESLSSAAAEEFRRSHDPVDRLLWRIRSEESKAFKECLALAPGSM